MGHIKEPAGVDFVINSRPLTKDEEIAISEFIRDYKSKYAKLKVSAKRPALKLTKRKKVLV